MTYFIIARETEVLLGPRVSKANKGYRVLLVAGTQMELKVQKGIQEHMRLVLHQQIPKTQSGEGRGRKQVGP